MPRYTVISTDCPGGATYALGGFLDYVPEAHRERLRGEMARLDAEQRERMGKLFAQEFMAEQDGSGAAQAGGRSGAWDAERRLAELEADGIVADVIFPDGSQSNAAPFQAAEGPGALGADHALQGVATSRRS